LSFELIEEAFRLAGLTATAMDFLLGAVIYAAALIPDFSPFPQPPPTNLQSPILPDQNECNRSQVPGLKVQRLFDSNALGMDSGILASNHILDLTCNPLNSLTSEPGTFEPLNAYK